MKFAVSKITDMDKNIKLLGIVSFLNDMSSEMIFPILPFFLATLGANSVLIGFSGGLLEGISGIMKVVSGYISDLIGKRKPIVIMGYSLSQLSKLGIALSKTAYTSILFLFLERSGKGLRTAPRDALIAESSKEKGRAFGFHRAMDSFGAVLGAIFAAILFVWINERMIILIAAIIGILSIFPLIALKDKASTTKPKLNLRVKKYIACSIIFGSANISYMFFLLRFDIVNALIMYALFNLVYASLSYPIGIISDKIKKKVVASIGYIFMFITCITAIFIPEVSLITLGIFMALTDATQRSFVAEISESYGFSLGAYQLVFGLSVLLANTIYGWLWGFSKIYTLMLAATMSIASSIVFLKI